MLYPQQVDASTGLKWKCLCSTAGCCNGSQSVAIAYQVLLRPLGEGLEAHLSGAQVLQLLEGVDDQKFWTELA